MADTTVLDINFTNQTRWGSLIVFEIVVFIVFLLNIFPGLTTPFSQLSTLIHELGHAIATKMTGGEAKGIWVFFKPKGLYGVTKFEGGNPYLIFPAGYLAPTIFSAGLILLSTLPYCASFTLAIVGLILMVSTLQFGKSCFTSLLGLGFGALFIWVALKADLFWSIFLLFLVAIQAAFSALADLKELGDVVRQDSPGEIEDDATQMASLFRRWPLLHSPMFWVRLWTLFSFLILIFSIWLTWLRDIT
jgi:hypothetical protein